MPTECAEARAWADRAAAGFTMVTAMTVADEVATGEAALAVEATGIGDLDAAVLVGAVALAVAVIGDMDRTTAVAEASRNKA